MEQKNIRKKKKFANRIFAKPFFHIRIFYIYIILERKSKVKDFIGYITIFYQIKHIKFKESNKFLNFLNTDSRLKLLPYKIIFNTIFFTENKLPASVEIF